MDPGSINVPIITVSIDDAGEFFGAISNALEKMSYIDLRDVYLFSSARSGVAISFDGGWKPFLGFAAGENPVDRRSHLPEGIWILDQIIDIISSWKHEIAGARVFITQDTAIRVIGDLTHTICIWDWDGKDPVRRVSQIHASIMQHASEKP